jgi:hypothetical protein
MPHSTGLGALSRIPIMTHPVQAVARAPRLIIPGPYIRQERLLPTLQARCRRLLHKVIILEGRDIHERSEANVLEANPRFKESPFYSIIEALTPVFECKGGFGIVSFVGSCTHPLSVP